MGIEIERKFLVKGDQWKSGVEPKFYRQGYLSFNRSATVRVRQTPEGSFLTVKGPSKGISRVEFEYSIPDPDAEILFQICAGVMVEKHRYLVSHEGHVWEVDEFLGDNFGLVVAEIELESEQEKFAIPDWIDREVSGDPKYFNSSLAQNPSNQWLDESSR